MKTLAFLSMLILTTSVFAQWNSDSLQNTAIISYTGEQSVPKVAATSDGGCYVAWYDHRGSNYDIYLQRLNASGEKLWAQDGLLVSDHPQDTWVTDFDLKVDQEDNAILAFNDIRNGDPAGWDVFAYKIAPDGSFLWGADGICLSASGNTQSEMAPKIAVTSDTNYVFVWSIDDDPNKLGMQKLSKNGTKLWGSDGKTLTGSSGEGMNHPQIVPALNDSIIVVWMAEIGSYPATKIWLVGQKFDPTGNKAWSSDVVIYNNGDIPPYRDFQLVADGQSGAFIAWEEHPGNESYLEVGYVRADGSLRFPLNGIKTSLSADRLHFYPNMAYVESIPALFVFWQETNSGQTEYGIYGQRFDLNGNRLWGDEGKVFVPLQAKANSYINVSTNDTYFYVSYLEGDWDRSVKTFYSDSSGNILWGPKSLSAASLGQKSNLQQVTSTQGFAILVWRDERNSDADIYGQNVNTDGSLGNSTSGVQHRDLPPKHFVLLYNYPNPFNPTTTIKYFLESTGVVELSIFNSAGQHLKTLVKRRQAAGWHQFVFNAQGFASGLYYCQLRTNNKTITRKMIYLR